MDRYNVTMVHQRAKYKIGIIEVAPWSYKSVGEDIWKGFCIDLIESLAQRMHFDYELLPSVDEETARTSNGMTKSGVFMDLASGKTDIMVAAVAMTAARGELVEYITPYFEYSGISIGQKLSSYSKTEKEIFNFQIFNGSQYRGLAEYYLRRGYYCIRTLVDGETHEPYEHQLFEDKNQQPFHVERELLVYDNFVCIARQWKNSACTFTSCALCRLLDIRSGDDDYVYCEYGSVPHCRTFAGTSSSLDRIWKDLALNEATKNETKYRTWDYPIREEYGQALIMIEHNNPVPNVTYGFEKVLENEQGEFALIHDAIEIKYRIVRDCRLVEVGEIFGERPYSIAVQKGSKLAAGITNTILDLQEERYFETLSIKYWNSSRFKSCYDVNEPNEGVTLDSLGGVFISVICGIILSFIVLISEISSEMHKKKISSMTIQSKKHFQRVLKSFEHSHVTRNDHLMKIFYKQKKKLGL